MIQKGFFIRSLEAGTYRENFFIGALFSMLSIRFFLFVTDYPIIGGNGFHIAHMLWGGILMMLAVIILISFLNKAAMNIASIIGGIGFGTFIDELGKFITSDNNYFYEPTIAIIYVIFILIYLLLKAIPKYKEVSDKEYLINAFEVTKDAIINDLDVDEEKRALEYLKKSDASDPTVKALKKLLEHIEAIPTPRPNIYVRTRLLLRKFYHRLAESNIIVTIVVVTISLLSLSIALVTLNIYLQDTKLTFDEWGRLFSSILSVICVFVGIILLRKSKYNGFRYFKFAVLISIFLTQFFLFYTAQLYALFGLAINILVLLIIDYVLSVEQKSPKDYI